MMIFSSLSQVKSGFNSYVIRILGGLVRKSCQVGVNIHGISPVGFHELQSEEDDGGETTNFQEVVVSLKLFILFYLRQPHNRGYLQKKYKLLQSGCCVRKPQLVPPQGVIV